MQTAAAVLVALSLAQAAPSTPASTGRIAGRVTVDGTDTPIAGARIMLLPAAPPMGPFGMPPQATSDQDGRFALENVAPGAYRVHVQKVGFASMDEPGLPDRAEAAQINAGQTTTIDRRLQRGGVIAGKVLDTSGEPAPETMVMALRRSNLSIRGAGPRLLPTGGGQPTNDLGEFRLAGLAPGEYYVAALARGTVAFGGPAVMPPSDGAASAMTFYPGTIDEAAAHPVTVAAGATAENIVISMQSVPGFNVSGRVVDDSGAPVAGAMVTLMTDGRGPAFLGPHAGAQTGDDGVFTIAQVPSGTYRVTASVPIMMGGPGGVVRGRGSAGGAPVGAGAGSAGTYMTWSSGAVSSGTAIGDVTSSIAGGGDTPTEVVVNGADVTGVRVLARRPAPQ
jgi:hypothetical protein